MNIQKTLNGTTLTVSLEGRLDTTTSPKLEEELRSSIDGIISLVIDFEKLEKAVPSLILLDVFFPTENGLDMLARLKKQHPQVKVLMVTGLKQETIAEEAKRLGADGILYKPFDTDDLLNAVKQVGL